MRRLGANGYRQSPPLVCSGTAKRLSAAVLLSGVTTLAASPAPAQDFPARHIRIVTSQAGGLNDLTARVLAQPLSGALGKQVIVDNRGVSAIDIVAKAAPDGHTVLCFASNVWTGLFPIPFLHLAVPL